jgi:hypothetical protein
MWIVLVTDVWSQWWDTLDESEQESVAVSISLLRERGPSLPRPHADTLRGSAHSNMRELRTQHHGRPLRTLYAFDPERQAILLCGGDKTGDDRFYDRMIPLADRLFSEHLADLSRKKGSE